MIYDHTSPFQPKNAHTLEILLMNPIFSPLNPSKNRPNRWRTEGEHTMYEGEHPERREPALPVTNIANMMKLSQPRHLPTSSLRIDSHTALLTRLFAPSQ